MRIVKPKTLLAVGLVAWASLAQAAEPVDRIIAWLRDQGFTEFEVEKTWLGRTKIEAHADGLEREIIINTRTGEILRDYWDIEDAQKAQEFLSFVNPLATVRDSSGSGKRALFEYHDDDDDDHDEDDEGDDRDDDKDDDVRHDDRDDEDDEQDEDRSGSNRSDDYDEDKDEEDEEDEPEDDDEKDDEDEEDDEDEKDDDDD
jgi:hypothetical protein